MTLFRFEDHAPKTPGDGDFWVAPGAQVMGQVALAAGASVWFNAVLRGDNEPIEIGAGSNVQDNCVVHTDPGCPVRVGAGCTIGHMAILHGCEVADGSLVGMGAIVLNGARIEKNVLIGAGALIPEGRVIPAGVLVIGRPGKVVRDLTEAEVAGLARSAEGYREKMRRFRAGLTPG